MVMNERGIVISTYTPISLQHLLHNLMAHECNIQPMLGLVQIFCTLRSSATIPSHFVALSSFTIFVFSFDLQCAKIHIFLRMKK